MAYANRTVSPRVLMFVHGDVVYDNRVRMEAGALATADFAVTVVGTHGASSPLPDHENIENWQLVRFRYSPRLEWLRRIPPLKRFRHILQAMTLIAFLRRQSVDIWHANDYSGLLPVLLARRFKRWPGKLVYDSHEMWFYRHTPAKNPLSRLLRRIGIVIERRAARRADLLLTTSDHKAERLAELWQTPLPVSILHGMHPADSADPLPRPDGARIWLVHIGFMMRIGRRLEAILYGLAAAPDDVHLTFLGEGLYEPALRALTEELHLADRVHFVPPVPPEAVCASVREADAAVIAFANQPLSYELTLPTKLFEAIGAGLPILTTYTTAMAGFLARYPIGVLWDADRPETLVGDIQQIEDGIQSGRFQAALQQAQADCGWPVQSRLLVDAYDRLRANTDPLPNLHKSVTK